MVLLRNGEINEGDYLLIFHIHLGLLVVVEWEQEGQNQEALGTEGRMGRRQKRW